MAQPSAAAPLSRRAFLAGASAFAVGALSPPQLRPAVARAPSDAAWRELARLIRGRLLRPGDAAFRTAAMPFNLRYADILPGGIAVCRETGDDDDRAIERALAWQDGFYAELARFARGGAYQNFSDPSLDDWAEAYYGPNLPRLREIKRAVDPDNVFHFAQSIPPA